jgi:hypothetical protein
MEPLTADRLPPWILHPYRLVSLGDLMKRFKAHLFTHMADLLGALSGSSEMAARLGNKIGPLIGYDLTEHTEDQSIDEESKGAMRELLNDFRCELADLGMSSPAVLARRIQELLGQPNCTYGQVHGFAADLSSRVTDELSSWS